MGIHRRHALHRVRHGGISFWLIYVLSIIFTFHSLLIAYSSSTYMEQFASPAMIGALYTIGSSIAVLAFLFISRILRKIGNVRLTIYLAVAEIGALVALGLSPSGATAIIAFVIFLILNPLLYLSIDIFSESLIGSDEKDTGSKRGLTLTLMSLAAVFGPIALSLIVGDDDSNLYKTYLVSAGIFSLFVLLVLSRFRTFHDPKYKEVKVLSAIQSFWDKKDIRNVFLSHFTLQIFFAWMTIYFPLYLATELGFTWDIIGSIFAVGLLAYVLIEYPVGVIADRYIGEKEMMAVGFLILAVTSSWISFMAEAPVVAWMILVFISRVGCSLVEATTESYFFKHTKGTDANIMSFFRLTRPLAMIAGALLGSATLLYLPFELIFIVLGLVMVPGIFFTIALNDTK
ncbi:MAG: MFS family permease [Acidimicrobiales bacterium]|jgi:MFS family permease